MTHLTQKERETFFEDVKNIYHTIAEYFKKNLPLANSFLRDVQILHPSFKSAQYTDEVGRIARAIPGLFTDREIDYSRDEWLQYSLEHIDEAWYVKEKKEDDSALVEKYGTYTTVNGHIRAVYAPYFHRNPGRCFTTVFNENTACIRSYTAQNAVLYTVP